MRSLATSWPLTASAAAVFSTRRSSGRSTTLATTKPFSTGWTFSPPARRFLTLTVLAEKIGTETKNSLDRGGKDRGQGVLPGSSPPENQHIFSPRSLGTITPYGGTAHFTFYPRGDITADTPATQ